MYQTKSLQLFIEAAKEGWDYILSSHTLAYVE